MDNRKPLSVAGASSVSTVLAVFPIGEATQERILRWAAASALLIVTVAVLGVVWWKQDRGTRRRQRLAHDLMHGTRNEILAALDGDDAKRWERCFDNTAVGIRDLFREAVQDDTVECVIRLARTPEANLYEVVGSQGATPHAAIPSESCLTAHFQQQDFHGCVLVNVTDFSKWASDAQADHGAVQKSFGKRRFAAVAPIVTRERGARYLAGFLHILSSEKAPTRTHGELLGFCADFISVTYGGIVKYVARQQILEARLRDEERARQLRAEKNRIKRLKKERLRP